MLTRTLLTLPVLALALAAADAPEPPKTPEPRFYKVEFTIREVEGTKVLNARSYSMALASDKSQSLSVVRASTRIPMPAGPQANQYQYADIGVRIDCRVTAEVQGSLALYVSADISSVPPETPGAPASAGPTMAPPTIRHNTWTSTVVVPLKKPTVVYFSDDPASKRQMQLEVTATPLR